MQGAVPWHARARAAAQRVGIDPRNLRRFRWLYKARVVKSYGAAVSRNLDFVFVDPEPHNFNYEVANLDAVAAWVSEITALDAAAARALIYEPEHDAELQLRLRHATRGHRLWAKPNPPFGRRVGWYALARALRPRLIVETGVHDGLGSMLLLRALERNLALGFHGTLVSFDINPAAGWLVGEHPCWRFRPQSSQDGLRELLADGSEIDLFLYDGWHSYDAEHAELELVVRHLSPNGVLLSDDAEITSALAEVCTAHGLDYFSVDTRPVNHFHPGTLLAAGRRPL